MSSLCLSATAEIFPTGPTMIGLIIPISAASTAPRNDVSSQGCTTSVVTAGHALARAIRLSYFDCSGWPNGLPVTMPPIALSSAESMISLVNAISVAIHRESYCLAKVDRGSARALRQYRSSINSFPASSAQDQLDQRPTLP